MKGVEGKRAASDAWSAGAPRSLQGREDGGCAAPQHGLRCPRAQLPLLGKDQWAGHGDGGPGARRTCHLTQGLKGNVVVPLVSSRAQMPVTDTQLPKPPLLLLSIRKHAEGVLLALAAVTVIGILQVLPHVTLAPLPMTIVPVGPDADAVAAAASYAAMSPETRGAGAPRAAAASVRRWRGAPELSGAA